MDQVRVVGLWDFGAQPIWTGADTGMGQHGDGLKWGQADAATQSKKFENKSNKTSI